jgi:hypothetical protein
MEIGKERVKGRKDGDQEVKSERKEGWRQEGRKKRRKDG